MRTYTPTLLPWGVGARALGASSSPLYDHESLDEALCAHVDVVVETSGNQAQNKLTLKLSENKLDTVREKTKAVDRCDSSPPAALAGSEASRRAL